jgi:hypothetical protein
MTDIYLILNRVPKRVYKKTGFEPATITSVGLSSI